MATTSAMSTTLLLPRQASFGPSRAVKSSTCARKFQVRASADSLKEKAIAGITAAMLTASTIVPDGAEAATVSPSLKNFLLSIAAGGAVLALLVGAVIAVANFDPVKRV